MKETDQHATTFITPFGTFEWNYMPFGFVNAPSIFQRAISETLESEELVSVAASVSNLAEK